MAAFFHWFSDTTISIILQLASMPAACLVACNWSASGSVANWAPSRDDPVPAGGFKICFAAQSTIISKMYDDESRSVVI
jgi:hypothetical protein